MIGFDRLNLRRALGSLGVMLSVAVLPVLVPSSAVQAQAPAAPYVPGEVLVRYRQGVRADQEREVLRGLAAGGSRKVGKARLHRIRLRAGATVDQAVQALKRNPLVEHAQPNFIYRASNVTRTLPAAGNDVNLGEGRMWGLDNRTADIDTDAPEAWSLTTGSRNVVVAVIDSGVDYTHPEFHYSEADPTSPTGVRAVSNIWTNPGEIAGNNVDDDKNGYVDDVHGWNASANNGNPMDDNGHGTHVAGTIGAASDENPVVGVNWKVSIIACKFLAADGSGTTADAIECLQYLHKLKDPDGNGLDDRNGVDIIASNNSWGGGGNDGVLREAIEKSNQLGILFVAASGNGDYWGRAINNDASPQYPASFPTDNIISVTATDSSDQKASWANYGRTSVDLAAPGVGILSTTPGNTYDTLNGTSMATPHVTGAVALLRALDLAHQTSTTTPLTHLQIKERLLYTGDPVAALDSLTLTGRRLNVYNALTNTRPAKPVNANMKVVVTTNKTSYRFGETVILNITATNSVTGAGVGGGSLWLDIRTPYGYMHSASGTLDANGKASFQYTPRKSYGSGTYRATATVSKAGYNTGSNSASPASFTVR